MRVIGNRGRGQSALSISIILIRTKEAAIKGKNEGGQTLSAGDRRQRAAIHLLIAASRREGEEGEAEDTSAREGGSWESARN